jgi:hypothetical protein
MSNWPTAASIHYSLDCGGHRLGIAEKQQRNKQEFPENRHGTLRSCHAAKPSRWKGDDLRDDMGIGPYPRGLPQHKYSWQVS